MNLKIKLLCISVLFNSYLFAQCNYQLVWADEFNGTAIDATKWSHQTGNGGWGNNELQNYTNSSLNSYVTNGKLHIKANEPFQGQYTSARMRTINKGDWRYGKIEALIKLPEGQGIWPAFWMMPSQSVYGGWPSSGEIDIMEYLGHDTNTMYATCHTGISSTNKTQHGSSYSIAGNFNTAFHLFSIEWQPNLIEWFLDGVLIHTTTPANLSPFSWPFDQQFHIILNVAVGGNWPGPPDNSTNFPQVMEVEYVRVYQQLDDITIKGDELVLPNTIGSTYSVPNIAGANFTWSVPACATLVSGQNTNEITVDWQAGGGDVIVYIELPCGIYKKQLTVTTSNNIWLNSGFENGLNGWNFLSYGGAVSNTYFETNIPFSENNSYCVNVNQLPSNFWEVQLRQDSHAVIASQSYKLSFYAKGNSASQRVGVYFRNEIGNAVADDVQFYINNNWTYYEYIFTPNTSIANLSTDINLGFETGLFCFDEIKFEVAGPNTFNCCTDYIFEFEPTTSNNIVIADKEVKSISNLNSFLSVNYKAGDVISLEPGFETPSFTNFCAEIEDCY